MNTTATLPSASTEPRRILAPVDFSGPSREAFRAATAMARRSGARLAAMHVTRRNRPDSHVVAEQMGLTFDTRRHGRARLHAFLEKEDIEGIRVTPLVIDGVPYDEIATAAKSWSADLIVIATHGYTGLKHALLGSTTERVVRHAPCPVLVTRSRRVRGAMQALVPDQVKSILVPLDFSACALDALRHALAFAARCGAQICLLHVIEPHFIDTKESRREARIMAHHRLEQLAGATKKLWPRTGRELRQGPIVATIAALARRTNADLIVMGTHGRSGLAGAFIGSIAERVVRLAPCSVLTVRDLAKR